MTPSPTRFPHAPREAAAGLASVRLGPAILLQLEVLELPGELAPALQAAGIDRSPDGAPGLRAVRAVVEPAPSGELLDVPEGVRDPGVRVPEPQLAHARRVEHEAAVRDPEQLALHGGVAAAP